MKAIAKIGLVLAAMVAGAFSLAACGGGGGGSTPAAMPEATSPQPRPSQPEAMPEATPEQAQPSLTQEQQEQQDRLESDRIKASFDALIDASNVIVESTGIQELPTDRASRNLERLFPDQGLLYKDGIEINNERAYRLNGISLAHGFGTFDSIDQGFLQDRKRVNVWAGLMEYGLFYIYAVGTTNYLTDAERAEIIELNRDPVDRWERFTHGMYALGDAQSRSYDDQSLIGTWRGAMLGADRQSNFERCGHRSASLGSCTPAEAAAIGLGNLLVGEATITSDGGRSIDIRIENITDAVTGARRPRIVWDDVTVQNDGSFSYFDTIGSVVHELLGSFAGPQAEEVSGVFWRSPIAGAFGAKK